MKKNLLYFALYTMFIVNAKASTQTDVLRTNINPDSLLELFDVKMIDQKDDAALQEQKITKETEDVKESTPQVQNAAELQQIKQEAPIDETAKSLSIDSELFKPLLDFFKAQQHQQQEIQQSDTSAPPANNQESKEDEQPYQQPFANKIDGNDDFEAYYTHMDMNGHVRVLVNNSQSEANYELKINDTDYVVVDKNNNEIFIDYYCHKDEIFNKTNDICNKLSSSDDKMHYEESNKNSDSKQYNMCSTSSSSSSNSNEDKKSNVGKIKISIIGDISKEDAQKIVQKIYDSIMQKFINKAANEHGKLDNQSEQLDADQYRYHKKKDSKRRRKNRRKNRDNMMRHPDLRGIIVRPDLLGVTEYQDLHGAPDLSNLPKTNGVFTPAKDNFPPYLKFSVIGGYKENKIVAEQFEKFMRQMYDNVNISIKLSQPNSKNQYDIIFVILKNIDEIDFLKCMLAYCTRYNYNAIKNEIAVALLSCDGNDRPEQLEYEVSKYEEYANILVNTLKTEIANMLRVAKMKKAIQNKVQQNGISNEMRNEMIMPNGMMIVPIEKTCCC